MVGHHHGHAYGGHADPRIGDVIDPKPMVKAQDDCIDYLNQYRAQVGKGPLSGSFDTGCEQSDAVNDCVNGWHDSFGQCGEGGQCEAACGSCYDAVDMFYNEGPGGGHYDIMMSDDYSSVFWGESDGCYSGNNFYTFNFYWPSGGNATAPRRGRHPSVYGDDAAPRGHHHGHAYGGHADPRIGDV